MSIKKPHSCCLETVQPVRDALEVINGKWRLAIISSIGVGNERFTDIQQSIPGITPKVLAKELKAMEQDQLLRRLVTGEYPGKVSYHLQSYAETLTPIILALKDWGLNHRKKIFSNS